MLLATRPSQGSPQGGDRPAEAPIVERSDQEPIEAQRRAATQIQIGTLLVVVVGSGSVVVGSGGGGAGSVGGGLDPSTAGWSWWVGRGRVGRRRRVGRSAGRSSAAQWWQSAAWSAAPWWRSVAWSVGACLAARVVGVGARGTGAGYGSPGTKRRAMLVVGRGA